MLRIIIINSFPERNKPFCPNCGERTIHSCPTCNYEIRGKGHSIGYARGLYHSPAYCESCGAAFPWTSRKIQAVFDLAALELTQEDQDILQNNVEDMMKDSPATRVAATRIKKVVLKVGGPLGESLRSLLVDIASETAKKIILGK